MPQQISLARSLITVGDDLGELRLDRAQLVIGGAVRRHRGHQCGAREPVEGRPLDRRPPQPNLVALSVHGDQVTPDVSQGGGRNGSPTEEAATAPLGRDDAGEHDGAVLVEGSPGLVNELREASREFGIARHHAGLHLGPSRPPADDAGVGAIPQEQSETGEHHRLAGTGLAGDRDQAGSAGSEVKGGLGDDAEAGHPQHLEHVSRPRPRTCARWSRAHRPRDDRAIRRRAGRTSRPAGP